MIPNQCNNSCYTIDSKTIEKTIIELKKDLEALTNLGNSYTELHGELADWMSGVTLIRNDYFLQHAMAVATDQVDLNPWPLMFIDWELAAEDLKKRYTPIDYGGVKYWVKKPT